MRLHHGGAENTERGKSVRRFRAPAAKPLVAAVRRFRAPVAERLVANVQLFDSSEGQA